MHRFQYLLASKALRRWVCAITVCVCALVLWPSQQIPVYAASIGATVSIADAPTTVPLGESFSLNLIFDNNSAATGFGPYINVFVPKSGADGDDGYTFSAATYLGAPVTSIAVDCPAGTTLSSPLTGLPVLCPASPIGTNQLIILQLPFGSFAPSQPPAPVRVSFTMSNKADVGVALPISVQAGFVYGSSAIGAEPSVSSAVMSNIAPSLIMLSKDYSGLEGETSTGPNYPRSFVIRASMPAGLTATNVLITDTLPNNIIYLGTSGSGFIVLQQPVIGSGPFSTPPLSNQLVLSVTGNIVGSGPSITVNYYVTATASDGKSVLGSSGTPSQTLNSVSAQATWSPVDIRDVGGVITGSASSSHRDLALAVQKFIDNANAPNSAGDVLTYTLAFQVSDFMTVGGIVITDSLANGHDYVPSSAQLNVTDRVGNVVGTLPINTITSTTLANGDTRLVFDVSAALIALGAADGVLQGGRAIAPNSVAASGQLVYRAAINDLYRNTGAALQPNDTLTNTAQIGGLVLSNSAPFTSVLGSVSDSTQVTLSLATPTLSKSFYAVNGNTTLPTPLKISPDDEVTYLLRYDMQTGDFRNLTLTDYLPLPMFDATTLTAFISSTTGIPAIGVAQWAPTMSSGDLSRLSTPTLSTDTEQNAAIFGFGNGSDTGNTPTQIAILFTVKASSKPYVDDLYFTNQVSSQQENSDGKINISSNIAPFRSAVPQLRIRKGIVGAGNPKAAITQTVVGPVSFAAAGTGTCANRFSGIIRSSDLATTPIDGNLINADGGDTVRYAIVIENTGSGRFGAFDTALRDVLPSNLSYVPSSLCVHSGNGGLLETVAPSTTLFTSGLTLTSVISRGQDYVGVITSTGNNIAVISFDAVINSAVTPTQQLTNTAILQNYASTAGGDNYVPIHSPSNAPLDSARISLSQPRFEKRLTASELLNAYNTNAQAVPGELVTYTLVLSVPEGTLSAVRITDTLPSGLIFQACDSADASSGVTSTLGGINAANVCASVSSGSSPVFDFGTLVNGNTNDAITETVAITFRAVVLNNTGNVTGTTLTNNATFNWQGNQPLGVSDANLKVIRPQLTVAKSVAPRAGDAGDVLTYLITVTNPSANSTLAYDVVLTDVLPTGVTYNSSSWANVSGVAGVLMASAPTLTATWSQLAPGQSSVLSFTATLNGNVAPNQAITNTAQGIFTSLPGLTATQRAIYSASAIEQSSSTSAAAAAIVVAPATIGKTLLGTEINTANNSNTRAAIGEVVTYTAVITIPEGVTPNAVITDNLPTGLAFVNFITYSAAAELQFSVPLTTLLAPSVTPVSGSTAGNRAVWSLGTITNTNTNNAIGETIQLTFTAVVLNVSGNVAGNTRANQAQFAWTGNATSLVSSGNITLIEPAMGLRKLVTPALGDSGDAITYTVVLTGPSGADAFDVTLFDALPVTTSGSFILTPTIASVSANATPAISAVDFALSGSSSAGYILRTASALDLPLNASRLITIVITGSLAENVLPSGYITNTAQMTYTSLDGFATPITRSIYNVNATERNYTRTASISSRVNPLDAQKTFIGSSEDNTGLGSDGLPRAQIGEVLAYRMAIRMAEATAPNLLMDFVDNLPDGLQYIPGSARVGFVANGRGITSSDISSTLPGCSGLNIVAGSLAAVDSSAITCPFPASQISIDANGRPKFAFGTVANLDTDADDEYVIVQLSAVVLNQASNQSGTLLPNNMDVMLNGHIEDSSEPITVTVAEPAIASSKSLEMGAAQDAGDVLTYTLLITNSSGANVSTAFDVVLTDVLDGNLQMISVSLSAPLVITSYTSAVDVLLTDTQHMTLTLAQLDPGGVATVTLWARVLPTATNGSSIPNTIAIGYSSLPTLTGSISNAVGVATPGASGTISGERTSAGGVNDYIAGSSVSANLDTPRISKLAPSPSQYAIGEVVTYTLLITVPEGVAQTLSVLDDLPPGLGYVSHALITAQYSGTVDAPIVTQPNGDVLWTFGNITTTADIDDSNNSFAIQVLAQVLNSSSPLNQEGSVLSNRAWLTYTHPVSGVQSVSGGAQAIRVIEPNVQMAKTVIATRQPVGANDLLTYTLRLTNTGNAAAHDLLITDALPSGLRFVATPQIVVGNAAVITDTNTFGDSALAWRISRLDNGQSAWVTFTAQVDRNVAANQSLVNVAQVFYSSVAGAWAQERGYTGTQVSAGVGTGLPAIGIVKQVSATTVQAGDLLTYIMTVSNSGLVAANGIVITDRLPINTSYVNASPSAVQANGLLTWTLGALAAYTDTASVTLTVRVNEPLRNGTVLTNVAWVSNANGGVITPSGQVTTLVNSAVVITLSKAVQSGTGSGSDVGIAQLGDIVTYSLSYTVSGNAPAFDVTISDSLPSELTALDFGAPLPTQQNGGVSVWAFGTLSPTRATPSTGVLTFTARLSSAPTLSGTQRINTADMTAQMRTDDGLSAGLSSSDSATVTVNSTHELWLAKQATLSPVTAGTRLTYTLSYSVTGNEPAFGVVLSDVLPSEVSLLTCDGGCVSAGQVISWALGDLNPGASGTQQIVVQIHADVLSGTTIFNSAVISDGNAGVTATAGVTVPVLTLADLVINKSASPEPVAVLGVLTYTLSYQNLGPSDAQNVLITDALPSGLMFGAVLSGAASVRDGALMTWSLGTLASGASGQIVFTSTVMDGTAERITNSAAISGDTPDANLLNNIAATTTQVTYADVYVDKDVLPKRVVLPGEVLTWTVLFGNQGNLTATDIVIRDVALPGSVFGGIVQQEAGLSGPVGSYPTMTWTLPQLAPGATGSIVFTVTSAVATSWDVLLTNTVEITSRTPQTVTANDSDRTVSPKIDLLLRKAVARSPVVEGELISFTISLSNTGGFTLSTVPLTDTFDADYLSYVSAQPNPDSLGAGQLHWNNLGPLPVQGAASVIVTFTAQSSTQGLDTVNHVSATGEYSGTRLDTQTASAALRITRPSLSVRKFSMHTGGLNGLVHPGELLTYTVVLSNAGDADANNVAISDTLPSMVALIASEPITPLMTGSLLQFNGLTVPSDSALTLTFTTRITASLPNGTALVNRVEISSSSSPVVTATDVVTDLISSGHALTLEKRVDLPIAAPGDVLRYTLVYSLHGNEPVFGVTISDALPSGLRYVDAQPAPSAQHGAHVEWAIGDIFQTGQITQTDDLVGSIILTAQVSSVPMLTGTQFINTVWMTESSGLSSDAGATVTIHSGHAFSVSKAAALTVVTAGAPLTYTVNYTLNGNEPAQGVLLSDVLPSEVLLLSCSAGCIDMGNGLRWDMGDVSPPATGQVTYVVAVSASVLSGTMLLNTVSITDGNGGVTATALVSTPVWAWADVSVSKTVALNALDVGEVLTYSLMYRNSGVSDARAVRVTDTLPAAVSFGGMLSGPQPSISGTLLAWDLGTLSHGVGGNMAFTVTVLAGAAEIITNSAIIGTDTHETDEADTSNNTASASTVVRYADVYVRKSVQPTRPVGAGEVLTWTIDYGNAGTATAHAVQITDVLPSGVDFGGLVSRDDLSLTLALPQLRWFTPTLAASASGQLVFTTTAKLATSQQVFIANTVDITSSSPQTSTALGNEHAEAITPKIDSAIGKTASRNVVVVGELVSYTIRISNTGGAVLTHVPMTDTYDATYLQFVSGEGAPSAMVNGKLGELQWANVGPIAPGARASVMVTFTALAATPSTRNSVTATGEYSGTVLPSISSAADIRITQPRLSVRKFSANEGGNPLRPGERITYTIVVRNEGDADATNVSISDTLPVWATGMNGSLSVQPSDTGAMLGAPPQLVQRALLQAGQAITVSYGALANASLANGSVLVNQVTISNSNGGPTGGVVTATDRVTDVIVSQHALALEKWAEPSVVAAGQVITYGLRYTVTGNAPAPNVVLSDVLPAQTTVLDCGVCNVNGQTLRWALGNLAPPSAGVLTFTVRVAANISAGAGGGLVITNLAEIGDDTGQRATAQASVSAGAHAALSIRKSVSASTVRYGDVLTYALTVHNDGPNDTGNGLSIVMPGETSSTIGQATPYPSVLSVSDLGEITDITVSLNSIQHSYAGDIDVLLVGPQGQKIMLMSDVGGIYPAQNTSLNFHDGAPLLPDADPLVSGTYRPTNYIANDGIETLPAPAPGLPYASALSSLIGTSANGEWQLFVMDDQKNDEGVFIRGWALTLETSKGNRVFATNAGVLISDWLPPGLQVMSVEPGYAAGNLALWTTSLSVGETKTFTVVARVGQGVASLITNTAAVTGTQPEDNLSDNIDQVTTSVRYIDLAISMTTPMSYTPGTSLTLPITVGNFGNLTVTQGMVTITLPAGITLTELPPGWRTVDEDEGVYVVPIGAISPGETLTLSLPVSVAPLLPVGTVLPVRVEVDDIAYPGSDINPSNNQDAGEAPVNSEVYLSLLKLSAVSSRMGLKRGDFVTYTLLISNTSGFTATQVLVQDRLPDGTVYVEASGRPSPTSNADMLVWQVPTLPPYTSLRIEFVVVVSSTSTTQTGVINSFTVDSAETAAQTSNEVADSYQATAIQLASFTGMWLGEPSSVRLMWQTALELNTWGFDLYRSSNAVRAYASKITPKLIPAVGRDGGAAYAFVDEAVDMREGYFYWLVETEIDGHQTDYGPIYVRAQPNRVDPQVLHLPLLLK